MKCLLYSRNIKENAYYEQDLFLSSNYFQKDFQIFSLLAE